MRLGEDIGSFVSGILLAPQFLAFLGLIPIVILLYLLKLRRTSVVISSTFLWVKSLQDLTANAPFQRLRKNLLLFLQILVLVFLVAALARPYFRAEGLQGSSHCIIIDRSASMQTLEDGTSRLEMAREAALSMVDNMRRSDRMMIMAFAESTEVLCELTDDRFRLRRAIRSIEASDTRTNIRDVLNVTRSLAPDNPEVEVVAPNLQLILMSDGNLSDLDEVGARAENMTYLKMGSSSNNAGIIGFNVRRSPDGVGGQQTFVMIRNEKEEALDTTLTLYFEGTVLSVEEIHVEPKDQGEVVFAHADLGDGILSVELDGTDDLAVDNRAWLALQQAALVKVLLVTPGDSTSGYFLKRALALEPRVELSAIEGEDYAATDEYDLIFFDGYSPEELPKGTLVFFDALPPIPGIAWDGTIENPPVLATDSDHPAMRFLNPGNISIREARKLMLPDGARTLVSTTGGALIADVSRGGRQILVVSFSISDSNWPLRLSFPLFLQNVVSWSPRSSFGAEMSTPTGKPLPLFPSPGIEVATVISPGGSRHEIPLDPMRPVFFGATERAGVYTVERGEERQRFAVNLLDKTESSISPAESISFGRGSVVAEREGVKLTQELWRWFVLAALAFLALEWWIYSRRAWI